jgi:hypothetical protein
MACGASVILCDTSGVGEKVTPERFDAMRKYNFGRLCLHQSAGVQEQTSRLEEQIGRFNRANVSEVTQMARQ